MKKILLIIVIVLCIFQMIVLATAIDIGSAAIDRATNTHVGDTRTYVDKNNPANESGTITSIEIWAHDSLANAEVATFFVVSGNNLSTRDTHSIGAVTAGSKQTFSGLNIDVHTGDYIGIVYSTAGSIERDDVGDGYWYIGSDQIPCTDYTFSSGADRAISVYGIGATAAAEEDNAIFFGTNF